MGEPLIIGRVYQRGVKDRIAYITYPKNVTVNCDSNQ